MLLLLGLLAITLPVFASAWLLRGSFSGALAGWIEYCAPWAFLMAIGAAIGVLWAGMDLLIT